MQIKTLSYLAILAIFISAIGGLFIIKDKVVTLSYRLSEVSKQIEQELDTIHISKAEFSYLSSPERLKHLSTKYLALDTVKINQMIKDPAASRPVAMLAASGGEQSNVNLPLISQPPNKWRYKPGPSKYLRTIANQSRGVKSIINAKKAS